MKIVNTTYKIENFLDFLPHRYPFLFIDQICDLKKNNYIRAMKNISYNEFFFQGHFPKKPIFPGVLVLESLGQASCILASKSCNNLKKKDCFYYLLGFNKVRFKQILFPGDQMFIEVFLKRIHRNFLIFTGISLVKNVITCKADIILSNNTYV